MTPSTDGEGRITTAYDYDTGCGFYADREGGWTRMTAPTHTQTWGEGKAQAIHNAIAPEHGGHGPIAAFGDSTGDFNFCTEFVTLKLVIFFNRADRSVTEGGGLLSEVAVYQRMMGYDLAKANAAGDTLYLLQGRDENGMRSFRNSEWTVQYGSDHEKLFLNDYNWAQLHYMLENGMGVGDILDQWSIKQKAGSSVFDFDIGFFDSYAGYHSRERCDRPRGPSAPASRPNTGMPPAPGDSRTSTVPSECATTTAEVMLRNSPHSTTPGMESIAAWMKNPLSMPFGNLQS